MNEIHLKKISPTFGEIRIEGTEKKPMFCLSDVCRALDIRNVSDCKSRLNQKGIAFIDTLTEGGRQQMIFIDEANLYKCIFQSRKREAEKFQDWVTDEILPSIRQDGGYMVIREDETEEDLMARALLVAQATLKRKEEKIRQLEAKAKLDAPKVDFFDSVAESKDAIEMKAVANTLNYISIGRNKLFAILREQKVLLPSNLPYQKYIDAGYFRTIETKKNCGSEIRIFIKTLVYQKGLDYIKKLLDKLGYKPKEQKS